MKKRILSLILGIAVALSVISAAPITSYAEYTTEIASFTYNDYTIPAYDGDHYEVVNGNDPNFTESEMVTEPFEKYSALDSLGRCGEAYANVCQELMPTEDRGSISSVTPTAWQSIKYDIVSGKYLYNRCHLIGFQLTGENANKKNLITGTRSLNVDAMLPIENEVAEYVEETDNHVLYRVTPIFMGNNLLATGVLIEAESVEDEGINICVFCYNVQEGIALDYSNGNSMLATEADNEFSLADSTVSLSSTSVTYNGKHHTPTVTVKKDGKTLKSETDYTVSYSNNKNVGTATVTVTGTGEYSGTITKTFTIKPKSISGLKFSSISNKTYTGKQIKPSVTIKDGSKELIKNTHYTVSFSANKNTGAGYVTIKGKGNYTGSKKLKFYIVPKKVSYSKVSAQKAAILIKWKKTTGATGYQIAYRKMGPNKYKYTYVSSTSKILKNLSRKKNYQIKVRAYKTVNGSKKFGAWSSVKKIKPK